MKITAQFLSDMVSGTSTKVAIPSGEFAWPDGLDGIGRKRGTYEIKLIVDGKVAATLPVHKTQKAITKLAADFAQIEASKDIAFFATWYPERSREEMIAFTGHAIAVR